MTISQFRDELERLVNSTLAKQQILGLVIEKELCEHVSTTTLAIVLDERRKMVTPELTEIIHGSDKHVLRTKPEETS